MGGVGSLCIANCSLDSCFSYHTSLERSLAQPCKKPVSLVSYSFVASLCVYMYCQKMWETTDIIIDKLQ